MIGEKVEWKKDSRVLRDENNKKYLETTVIDINYSEVKKEDVLNEKLYENSSELQQMIYHAYKKIEALETQLNDALKRITELEKG